MCNEPYVPKTLAVTASAASAATYESPFGEDSRPHTSTRVKSRTKPRTPYVQSAPQMSHVKRPRSRRTAATSAASAASEATTSEATSSFYMFLSLPNTPDTELMMNPSSKVIPGTESYI